MGDLIDKLVGTVTLRPYVFVFLAVYIVHAVTFYNWKKTLAFSLMAYAVAWVCEWNSIHRGFPFGDYKYVTATMDRELWIGGVPLFDSMSFIFLGYFSYQVGCLWLSKRSFWLTKCLLAGILMMYLDIIIDPLTLQGDKWFLGNIYYYPTPGPYFGVTLENFWGWFGLGFVLAVLAKGIFGSTKHETLWIFRWSSLAVYFGIAIFNIAITFSIGDRNLAWVGIFLMAPIFIHYITRPKDVVLWS